MKYRSRTDIVGLILEAANGGATKTKIMYKAFLSYAQLKEYLTVLLQNDVLEYEDEMHLFRTTEKGLRLLQMYNQIDEMISIANVKKYTIFFSFSFNFIVVSIGSYYRILNNLWIGSPYTLLS